MRSANSIILFIPSVRSRLGSCFDAILKYLCEDYYFI